MSEKIIDRVKSHFDAKETKIIEVTEWGDADKPLYIYATPMTLAQKNRLYKMAKDDDLTLMVEALIMKAKDNEGNPIFTRGDKPDLMRSCDPDILIRVENSIIGENDDSNDLEDIKKN